MPAREFVELADRVGAMDVSGVRKVFDLARSIDNPVNFSIGQPHFDVPEEAKDAAIKAIKAGQNTYTQTQGGPELRAALMQFLPHGRYADDEILVPRHDPHRGEGHGLLPGAAEAMKSHSGRRVRPTGIERGHACDVVRVVAAARPATDDDVVDLGGVETDRISECDGAHRQFAYRSCLAKQPTFEPSRLCR